MATTPATATPTTPATPAAPTTPATPAAPVPSGGGATSGPGTAPLDPSQSTLSPNFADYIYNMLGMGDAFAQQNYQQFNGQRYAGPSQLQNRAFTGLGGLQMPAQFGQATNMLNSGAKGLASVAPYQATKFTAPQIGRGLDASNKASVQSFMSPYQQQVLDTNKREAIRQSTIQDQGRDAQAVKSGAFGGSRQGIQQAEADRNLQTELGKIQNEGMQDAYTQAMNAMNQQRNANITVDTTNAASNLKTQELGDTSRLNQFGAGLRGVDAYSNLAQGMGNIGAAQIGAQRGILSDQLAGGATQNALNQQPLDFGYQQFRESRDYPMTQANFMHGLLNGLPMKANPYETGDNALLQALMGGLGGINLAKAT